ncbi:MAG: HU family DNA-binding protein [Lachnospiraceae bacterium]
MTKTDLVEVIVKETGLTKKAASDAVTALTDSVVEALKKGDKVALVGFGTFEVAKRDARKGRNPQTGKEIKIKASKSPKFKAGKALKDAVNGTKTKKKVK